MSLASTSHDELPCQYYHSATITLWWTNIFPWKITIFNGKIHYFYGHFPLLFVCSPEGTFPGSSRPGTSAASCEPPQEPTDAFRSPQHPQRLVATAHPHRHPCKWPWDTDASPMAHLDVEQPKTKHIWNPNDIPTSWWTKSVHFPNFSTETPHSEMIRQESCPSGFKATIFQENMASQGCFIASPGKKGPHLASKTLVNYW